MKTDRPTDRPIDQHLEENQWIWRTHDPLVANTGSIGHQVYLVSDDNQAYYSLSVAEMNEAEVYCGHESESVNRREFNFVPNSNFVDNENTDENVTVVAAAGLSRIERTTSSTSSITSDNSTLRRSQRSRKKAKI